MKECILHLGSNIGNPAHNIEVAEYLIYKHIGVIISKSKIYKTEAWGKKDQDDFLNRALKVATALEPDEILLRCQKIEKKMGRVKTEKWGPRIIDIDIIFLENEIISKPGLNIPHPRLTSRNFVLVPLMDICPDHIHPELNMTVKEIYKASKDKSQVHSYKE